MDGCRISIVLPVLNMCDSVGRAIESVINQKYDNKELLVLDGGSTDGTVDVIAKYKDYIDYYISEKDGGSSAAIAHNLSRVTGDYVAVLGVDDWYEPGAFSALNKSYQKEKADVYYGNHNEIMSDGQVVMKSSEKIDLDTVYYQCPFNTNAAFVKPLLLKHYYSEYWIKHKYELDMASDHYLWLVLYRMGCKFSFIQSENAIVNFNMSGRSNSNMAKLCKQNKNVMLYVLSPDDPDYDNRVRICDKYCTTRLCRNVLEMHNETNKQKLQQLLRKYLDIKDRYVIFGAGHMGLDAYDVLCFAGIHAEYYIDNYTHTYLDNLNGISIYRPEKLKTETNLTVVIASVGYEKEMEKQFYDLKAHASVKHVLYTDICMQICSEIEEIDM